MTLNFPIAFTAHRVFSFFDKKLDRFFSSFSLEIFVFRRTTWRLYPRASKFITGMNFIIVPDSFNFFIL